MNYRIPLFALNYGPEEEAAVMETLRSKWISMGPRTAQLENEFAEMLGSPHAVAITNCTAALHLALAVLGIGPGDEVITSSLTFVATVNAIRYVGATPVFCDIAGSQDLNMDVRHIEAAITPNTRAIMVMHYGGFPADMKTVLALAKKNNLRVIEDACHGPLSEYNGRRLGTLGDVGCFSFFSNKNISTGEGGMMVMSDPVLSERVRLLRSHGMTSMSFDRAKGHATAYDVVDLGYNYRMDDIRASLGLAQLKKLRKDLDQRAVVRKQYLDLLSDVGDIVIPFASHGGFVSNYIFPILLKKGGVEHRETIRERLHKTGIQTSVHYPAAHRFSVYRDLLCELPETEHATDHEITLPMYAGLKEEDVVFVANALKDALCL
jgi:dTDP-4-amino-4,6-dideoxygalactose transaminase